MKRIILGIAVVLSFLFFLSSCDAPGDVDHDCVWGEWEIVEGKEPTCEKEGTAVRVCTLDASHKETKSVPTTEHSYGDEYFTDSETHWQFCTICEERGDGVPHESSGPATSENAEICTVCGYEMAAQLHFMTNKKVIIIGNSHTYFGGVVREKTQDILTLNSRNNDTGFFYRLCTVNGAENVQVTNWTFGNHSLKDLFSGDCQADRACGNGTNHFQYLTDNNYDYVIFQNGSTDGSSIMYWIDYMMAFFKEGNPNTKFVMLVQARAHNDGYSWLSDLDEIEDKGVIIVDWGAVAYDLYSGAVKLPGDTLPLDKNTFVIAKDSKDGYHPSLLAGYVATVMAYSAITGEAVLGQNYEFCSVSRDFDEFVSKYYKVGTTNFPEVFKSPETMFELQALIDKYLTEKKYRNY